MKLLLFLYVCGSITLTAQSSLRIENITLFDGDQVIKNTVIQVENGKIVEIGKSAKKVDTIIDGTGKFVIPGMINAHVHAWGLGSLQQAAKAGVLSVLDMHGHEPSQSGLVKYKDSTGYARYFKAGFAATAPGGHGTQYGFPVPTLEKPEDAKAFITERIANGADYIKVIVEPWKTTLSHQTVKAIIEESHKSNRKVVVHVSKMDDGYQVLKNGADGLVHIWSDQQIPDKMLKELTDQKTFFVIPTLLTNILVQKAYFQKTEEETEKVKQFLLAEIKRLYDAGVTLLAGTDPPNANINYGTDLYKEIQLLTEAGIPALDALKSATSYTAQQFQLKDIGKLKAGYDADFIVLIKNPLEDITNLNSIEYIWKKGKQLSLK
ncbi:amidohydrolase family protein [Aquimarina sp. ERC-38]|uniref:amidohydrolase family protein n=1 Tax=Aquimarina sp. ERC-38 TaxID=2949996 RepID=UPI00224835E0|nr:amidohydrolase family protein [Aquimarina sp. ERC-38]UZO80334.1 amidohydrolase family protein [Aquimarina sp. ERC-38]